jgi:murein DD-endopeptidase MepM/ murein hydrolase activator NlpD
MSQKKLIIETEFGYEIDPVKGFTNFHSGVDIKAYLGDKVQASADGKVVKVEWYGGYGHCVIIEHKDGIQTLYGHMSKVLVTKDANLKRGDMVGLAGSTGISTGPQIHFEVKVKKNDEAYQSVDPLEFMKKQNFEADN